MIAFGPVPSRRLGLSLGINNIGSQKLCSYSCVYCQLGDTPQKTISRRTCFEPEQVLREVEAHIKKLDSEHQPDYLTLVTNGEPTLDLSLGKSIKQLRTLEIPIAVITNASTIYLPEIRDSLLEADWISLKIDTIHEGKWKDINRPHKSLNFKLILQGISTFAREFRNKLHTETMLLNGFNDATDRLEETASFIAELHPVTSYLSIPTRPCAEKTVKPVSESKLTEAWQIFTKKGINTELLTGFEGTDTGFTGNAFEDILNITAVHPMREDQVKELIIKEEADPSVIRSLLHLRLVKKIHYEGHDYYARNYQV